MKQGIMTFLTAAMVLAAGAFFAAPDARAELRVHFIDVGQGDAILLETDTHAVLVDAGNDDGAALSYLRQAGVTRLNLVVATHAHADHIGGLVSVIPAMDVGEIWYNGQTHTTRTFERFVDAVLDSGAAYREPARGEVTEYGNLRVEVLHPRGSAADYAGHLHDMNVVIRAVYGDVAFMLTGDAEAPVEAELLASGMDLSARVLKMGHHGSHTSTTAAFAAAVSPQVAIYQAGEGNSYGHPHREAVDILERAGVQVYGTETWGTIVVATDGHAISMTATGTGSRYDAPAPSSADAAVSGCVDLNTASPGELVRIVNVGEARAAAIVQGRPWRAVSELTRVNGIGPSVLASIKGQGLACVGG